MCSQSGLEGPGWALGTEQSVTSNDTISFHSQDCSQMAKSFISSSNEVGLGRLLDEFRVGNLLRPDKSCFLSVDTCRPDTYVARLDASSRTFQTSRSASDLSLDAGHVDTDIGHVAHTESLLTPPNSAYVKNNKPVATSSVETPDVIPSIVAVIHTACNFISALSPVWFRGLLASEVVHLVADIVATSSMDIAIKAAETAAHGFVIPQATIMKDAADLVIAGSIEALIQTRQAHTSDSRFNIERCDRWFSDDIEYNTLRALALHGAVIDVGPEFFPTSRPERLRPLVKNLQHTFYKHAADLQQKGQALLLPLEVAIACDVHFSPVHWTPKPGKPEGRFLCDLSHAEAGCALNEDSAKILIEERYGAVEYPTITNIVDKIFECASMAGGLHNVRLWKEDIVGAFNQFNFTPASARHLAFQIGADVVLIVFTGVFGWQGSPAVWAVFSRALLRAAEGRLAGLIVVYVDDFIGISIASDAHNDQLLLREVVLGVFGCEAINTDKSVLPTQTTDCIGWTTDLIRGIIYPNEKGRRKLIAAFFGCDLFEPIEQNKLQCMASLASRYSEALIGTRPFVSALYKASVHVKPRRVDSETRACITVWRAIALMAISDPIALATPMTWMSSKQGKAKYIVTSDAGPLGLGVLVRDRVGKLLAFVSYRLPFSADGSQPVQVLESRFQNVREFMGAILSVILCYQLEGGPCFIHWINDNIAALSWVQKDLAKSKSAQFAFLMYTWLSLCGGIRVVSSQHIPGITMGCVDHLSRFTPTPQLPKSEDWSERLPSSLLDKLFLRCDPVVSNQCNLENWGDLLTEIILSAKSCLVLWPINTS